MATLFGVATSLVAMGRRGDLIDTQREWLRRRDIWAGMKPAWPMSTGLVFNN